MPKGKNQKLKLYYLSRIMLEKTDDNHALTMPQIQKELGRYDVTADRKSLYDDLEALKVLGLDITKDGATFTDAFDLDDDFFFERRYFTPR